MTSVAPRALPACLHDLTPSPAAAGPEDFDTFAQALATRLAGEYAVTPPPMPGSGDATALPDWLDDTFVYRWLSDAEPSDEPSVCVRCGELTSLPVLCARCLSERERLGEEWACPFYGPDASCMVPGEGRRPTGCGGLLQACHYPERLLPAHAGACHEIP